MRKKFNIFYLILVFVSLSIPTCAKDKFFLLPKDANSALQTIVDNIDHSKKSIKISIYDFTLKKLAKRIKYAAKRGVKIEIIFDERTSKKHKKNSQIYYLAKYKNISVYRLRGKLSKNKKFHGIMHMKIALFDKNRVIFGSANWSNNAFKRNYELLYFTKNYAIAKKFDNYFDIMKKNSRPFK